MPALVALRAASVLRPEARMQTNVNCDNSDPHFRSFRFFAWCGKGPQIRILLHRQHMHASERSVAVVQQSVALHVQTSKKS